MRNVAAVGLVKDLARRADEGRPIRIAIIGCGEMGTDLVTQIAQMPGLAVGIIADRSGRGALPAIALAHGDETRGKRAETELSASVAIESGHIAIVPDAKLAAAHPLIDVVVDATGRPSVGAEIGLHALQHGKHLVMMNVEADVTIGPYLSNEARKRGLVYTVGAGDEPSSAMELIEFVSALGATIVSAGKGKNNPLRFDAVPSEYEEEAARRNMNPRMLVEFVDGSKTMVEMCAIANATGLVPDVPGMHGPAADKDQLTKVLVPKSDGGLLHRKGVVDYTVGKGVAPGVFVVAEMAHPRLRERMEDLKMGHGPYFLFHRPFHLTSLEVPLSCARAVLYGKADMVPLDRPVAEVCAVAKRNLKAGETLDFIGETTYRSFTMTVADAQAAEAQPCGLLEGGTVLENIEKGALLTRRNIRIRENTPLFAMRQSMDALLYPEPPAPH